MGYKEDFKVLQQSLVELRSWTKEQEAAIGKLQIDSAVQAQSISLHKEYTEGQFDIIRKALHKQTNAMTILQNEFSKQTLKIIIWVVGFITSIAGIGLAIYGTLH